MTTIAFNLVRVSEWIISDLLFVLTGFTVVLNLLSGRTRHLATAHQRRHCPMLLIGALILLGAGAITSLWSLDPMMSMVVVGRYAWVILLWPWIVRAVTPDGRSLLMLVRAFKVSVLIGAGGAVLTYAGLIQTGVENKEGRSTGFFGHSNQLGMMLVVGLAFFLLDVASVNKRAGAGTRTPLRLGMLAFVVFALATTGSISSMVGAVVVVAVIGVLHLRGIIRQRPRRASDPLKLFLLVFVALVAISLLITSDAPVVERFEALQEGSSSVSSSASSRGEHADFALERITRHILVGAGLDAGSASYELGQVNSVRIHNIYLKMLYESSMVGVIGLLIVQIATFRQAIRLLQATRSTSLNALAAANLAALCGVLAVAQVQPANYERFLWVPVALTTALWAVCRKELRPIANAPTVVMGTLGPRRRTYGKDDG